MVDIRDIAGELRRFGHDRYFNYCYKSALIEGRYHIFIAKKNDLAIQAILHTWKDVDTWLEGEMAEKTSSHHTDSANFAREVLGESY